MASRQSTAAVLEERLLRGDFLLSGFPGERDLAVEVGVSRTTTRHALADLVERGLLERQPNGRIVPRTDSGPLASLTRVAYLRAADGHPNRTFDRLQHLARESGIRVRSVEFVSWDDPVIRQTVACFDGVFFDPPAEVAPEEMLEFLRTSGRPVVSIERDYSAWGIRSLVPFPTHLGNAGLDHLHALGHRRIACLNTQPRDTVMSDRIHAWSIWKAARGVEGALHDEAVPSYGDPLAAAHAAVTRLLAAGSFGATAVWCTTSAAALGATRAARDIGLHVGRDLSVAAFNDEGLNRYVHPSITSLQPPDADPFLRLCLNWIDAGGAAADWHSPLLLQPERLDFFAGESTGPAPDA